MGTNNAGGSTWVGTGTVSFDVKSVHNCFHVPMPKIGKIDGATVSLSITGMRPRLQGVPSWELQRSEIPADGLSNNSVDVAFDIATYNVSRYQIAYTVFANAKPPVKLDSTIKRGMAFCYLSKDPIPSGYAAFDGSSKWPNAAWVPGSLAGHPLDDARGSAVVIGNDNAIGRVDGNNTITATTPSYTLAPTYSSSAGAIPMMNGTQRRVLQGVQQSLIPPPFSIISNQEGNSYIDTDFTIGNVSVLTGVVINPINVPPQTMNGTISSIRALQCRWIVRVDD